MNKKNIININNINIDLTEAKSLREVEESLYEALFGALIRRGEPLYDQMGAGFQLPSDRGVAIELLKELDGDESWMAAQIREAIRWADLSARTRAEVICDIITREVILLLTQQNDLAWASRRVRDAIVFGLDVHMDVQFPDFSHSSGYPEEWDDMYTDDILEVSGASEEDLRIAQHVLRDAEVWKSGESPALIGVDSRHQRAERALMAARIKDERLRAFVFENAV